jgi:murein DD-endopeptidase MepM/ murein hydrolase activator NlpD
MKFRGGVRRRGVGAVWWVLVLGWLLAACAPRVEMPAPVVGGAPALGVQSVTIQRGQSLSEIAQTHHVPMRAIAEANGLSPPYRIQTGRTLIIPGTSQQRAPAAVAALPNPRPQDTLAYAVAPDRPVPAASATPPVLAAPMPPTGPAMTAPVGEPASLAAKSAPDIAPPPPVSPTSPAPGASPEPPAASTPAAPPAQRGSAFVWPVRGHVLASYGSRPDGSHNDGINISAPRGAAVQAADAGVVAYTGNELRGYGNLILIKHADGWISAYAHCDQILVKRGERVTRGQIIARVGSTGNVSEPQLHFELRRGNHAVDPREFLAPLPTATAKDSRSG